MRPEVLALIRENIAKGEIALTELDKDIRDGEMAGLNMADVKLQYRDLLKANLKLKQVYSK